MGKKEKEHSVSGNLKYIHNKPDEFARNTFYAPTNIKTTYNDRPQ